ncbi:MAG: universal stress protein [Desulfobacterales bacterium]|nr:universal stress protein [Desulfobacterales bacterium]
MFKKILFATTASPTCDDAAKVAFELAKRYKAKLCAFHVFGIPTHGASPFVVDVRTGEEESIDPDYTEWVKEEMKNTYALQLADAENCDIDCTIGVPHTEILRKARKENVDLIVMGAHTRQEDVGATRYRKIVGSTMQRVAKSARCPVLIISRPCDTCFWYFSNIIFGTDFSVASLSAFMFASKLARQIGCKLYLFHAVDLSTIQLGKSEEQEEIERKVAEAQQKIEKLYVPKLDGYDNYEIAIREGIPHVEILKFSREKSGDLIVMSHHTRAVDPEEAMLGSTVEQVVLRSACPVASVNHPDKVSDD